MVRIVTLYVSTSPVISGMHFVWLHTGHWIYELTPKKWRTGLAALGAYIVIIAISMIANDKGDNTRANRLISLLGLVIAIAVLWVTSRNRRAIRWHTVIVGMLTQFLVALFVLRTKAGYDIFAFLSEMCRALLGFANEGTTFLTAKTVPDLHWFLTGVIPAIIFFVAFVQLLYYWGVLQWFVGKFGSFFFWTMRVSGAEAVVAAASPFIGQGESAMLIRPFVKHLTNAELHQVMASGFATIAGSVLVAYINLGVSGQALISSCVMSIPASLAVSKLRYPEEEESLTAGKVVVPKDDGPDKPVNALHAFANGMYPALVC